MTTKQFHFGVDITTKIDKYSRRFTDLQGFLDEDYDGEHHMLWDNQEECWVHLDEALELMEKEYSNIEKENEQLKKELNKLKKFEYGGEHIRLSINIETGELQRHIYATGQWFGDFDRVLVDNWLSKEDYQRFINRVIEVYNTEFKKELEE